MIILKSEINIKNKFWNIISFIIIWFLFESPAFGDYWTQKSSIPVNGRFMAVAFNIGGIGYIGCGWDTMYHYNKDFWAYDPVNDSWSQKAGFPAGERSGAIGFSIGNKGYMGFGGDSSGVFHSDLWEYNPTFNNWIPKTGNPGIERFESKCVTLNNMGFVAGGWNSTGGYYDMWCYDPALDSWSPKSSLPDSNSGFNFFTIGGSAYLTLGRVQGILNNKTWEYDFATDSWTQKSNFAGIPRDGASDFTINDVAFVGTGSDINGTFNDFWKYEPISDQWSQITNLPGSDRNCASGWSINGKGYILCGKNVINGPNATIYNDLWEYIVDSTTSLPESDEIRNLVLVYPNPFSEQATIFLEEISTGSTLTIYSSNGSAIESIKLIKNKEIKLYRNNKRPGKYFFSIDSNYKNLGSGYFTIK